MVNPSNANKSKEILCPKKALILQMNTRMISRALLRAQMDSVISGNLFLSSATIEGDDATSAILSSAGITREEYTSNS